MSIDIEDLNNNGLSHLHVNNMKLIQCVPVKPVLIEILDNLGDDTTINSKKKYEALYVSVKKKHKLMAKKAELFYLYMHLRNLHKIVPNELFEKFNVVRETRGNSGVLVIAVMFSPNPTTIVNGEKVTQEFTCKWDCHYCPKEPGQPRSYLSSEPCVSRGTRNNHDPCEQFNERASTHFINGHTVDKIEILILGGTFHSYPEDYRKWFIKMLIYSANTFYQTDKRDPLSFDEEVIDNETATVRIIGITIETRPDCINPKTLLELRKLEVTRIQMGLQHTDDDILSQNNRGHKLKHTIRGIQYAMNAGFKVDIHLMTNLPGATPEKDRAMFKRVLSDPNCQGDQWKIYPTQVTPFTEIAEQFNTGEYIPYPADEMFEVILEAKPKIWPWIRNNRIIRDFSSKDDIAGNIVPNMRQDLHNELKKRGQKCQCIRCREVRNDITNIDKARLTTRYIQGEIDNEYGTRHAQSSNSKDYFLSFESCTCKPCEKYFWHIVSGCGDWKGCYNRDKLYGFLRLRIYTCDNKEFPELYGHKIAFIRELHVYGKITAVGKSKEGGVQHYSFGRQLIMKAEQIASNEMCDKLAIISGLGVRRYYEKFGYTKSDIGKYMMKDVVLKKDYTIPLYIIFFGVIYLMYCYLFISHFLSLM
jgi:ELP3 family radical SAM enzyme/protein acetyltransferase